MLVRRLAALAASILSFLFVSATAALATSGPDYPPSVGGTGTEVEGTVVPSSDVANSGAGLPHTGFEVGLLVTALVLVALGVALVVSTRRRQRVMAI
jgi:hypothetical protein